MNSNTLKLGDRRVSTAFGNLHSDPVCIMTRAIIPSSLFISLHVDCIRNRCRVETFYSSGQ